MVQQNTTTKLEVNKVKIEFTDKEITAYGGYSLLAKFFDKIALRKELDNIIGVKESSPNATGIYAKIIGFILILFAGGERFSHLLYLGSKESLAKLFKIKRLPQASTTLTRLFNKILSTEKVACALWEYTSKLLPWQALQKDWLSFDSTVIERYGAQEGAKKGYNPKKHGRPSHHPLIAFLNKNKYVINFKNRDGNVSCSYNVCDFFKETLERIQDKICIEGILGDSGFYDEAFIEMLENADKTYIIAARLYWPLQRKIYSLKDWQPVDDGIDIAEFTFTHQAWSKERRYIAVRQNIEQRKQAMGKQMKLFENECKQYRYSVWIASSKEAAYDVWLRCRQRANDENTIKELKEDFALGGFCLQKFAPTEAAMLVRVFTYNLFTLFRTVVMQQKEKIERLKTLRYKYFVIPAQFGRRGRHYVLRISTPWQGIKQKFAQLFANINQWVINNHGNCNAFG